MTASPVHLSPTIRRAAAADIPSLCAICRESFPATLRWQARFGLDRAWWRAAIASAAAECHVLSSPDNRVLGFSVLVTDEPAWNRERTLRAGSLAPRVFSAISNPGLILREHAHRREARNAGLPQAPATDTSRRLWLELIAVTSSARGSGAAAALLSHGESRARDLGREELRLRVAASNPGAIRFYEKHGYSHAGSSAGGLILTKDLHRPNVPAVADDSAPDLSIIIVSYNTRDLTLECLRSLYDQTSGCSFEVLVIDNASTDGSADAIRDRFPQAKLKALKDNLGFAGGNNLAAKSAIGRSLLLLNPDTIVLDGAIQQLLAFARRTPSAGIWGGRTLFADRSLNPTSCWMRQTLWSVFCRAMGLTAAFGRSTLFNPEAMGGWARDTERQVDIVTGCFLLIRRDTWERLGGFDPAFFMYGEEADLCLRARALGCRPRISPDATIVHYGGASEPVRAEKLVRLLRAKAGLIHRHWPPARARVGVWLLALWCRNHAFAWGLVGLFNPKRARQARDVWLAGWRRRAEWMNGMTPRPAPAPIPTPAAQRGPTPC